MSAPIRLGLITPSSNTCLEPVATAMLQGFEDRVSVHFTRVPVTRIDLGAAATAQFDFEQMLVAARLLADAEVSVVAWAGTSSSWLGVKRDEMLCNAIESTIGVPTTTSTLAVLDALCVNGVREYGLVVPYTDDVAQEIATVYAREGFDCKHSAHVGLTRNFDFAQVSPEDIRRLVTDAAPGCATVLVVCTNMRAAPLVAGLERAHGLLIVDSVIATVWKCLDLGRVRLALTGWGDLAANGSLRGALRERLIALRDATTASRVTVRLELPSRRLHVDEVAAEAIADGVNSIRHDSSLDQWAMPTVKWLARERRTLVQQDFASDGPPVAPELAATYGVAAQMLSPLCRNGRMYGWISVHEVGRARQWRESDVGALEETAARVERIIDEQVGYGA